MTTREQLWQEAVRIGKEMNESRDEYGPPWHAPGWPYAVVDVLSVLHKLGLYTLPDEEIEP